jgi:NADH dehydrogenase (ubiquinone) Fe-S protein 1
VEAAGVVRPDWNGYNVIHDAASRVAALDIGFQPSAAAKAAPPAKMVFLLGADDWEEGMVPKDAFVVYQVG